MNRIVGGGSEGDILKEVKVHECGEFIVKPQEFTVLLQLL